MSFVGKDINDKADVIFVCVKSYSLEDIIPVIKRAADADTIIIPILNMFKTGAKIKEYLPEVKCLEGCIYISALIDAPGKIVHAGDTFKVFFGNPYNEDVKEEIMEQVVPILSPQALRRVSPTTYSGIRSKNSHSFRPLPPQELTMT